MSNKFVTVGRKRTDTPNIRRVSALISGTLDSEKTDSKKPSFPSSAVADDMFGTFDSAGKEEARGNVKIEGNSDSPKTLPDFSLSKKLKAPSFPSAFSDELTGSSFFDKLSEKNEILDFTKKMKKNGDINTSITHSPNSPKTAPSNESRISDFGSSSPKFQYGDFFPQSPQTAPSNVPTIPKFSSNFSRNEGSGLFSKKELTNQTLSSTHFEETKKISSNKRMNMRNKIFEKYKQKNIEENIFLSSSSKTFEQDFDKQKNIVKSTTSSTKLPIFPKQEHDGFSDSLFSLPPEKSIGISKQKKTQKFEKEKKKSRFAPLFNNQKNTYSEIFKSPNFSNLLYNSPEPPSKKAEIIPKRRDEDMVRKNILPIFNNSPSIPNIQNLQNLQNQHEFEIENSPEFSEIPKISGFSSSNSSLQNSPKSPQKARMPMPYNSLLTSTPSLRPIANLHDYSTNPCPVFAFGFGGKVVCSFPSRIQESQEDEKFGVESLYFQNSPFTSSGNLQITGILDHCKRCDPKGFDREVFDDRFIDDFFRFPGPISSSKDIDDIVKYLNGDVINKENERKKSNFFMDTTFEDGIRFLEILRTICKFHQPELEKVTRSICVLLSVRRESSLVFEKFANEDTSENSKSDYNVSLTPISETKENFKKLHNLLMNGEIDEAVKFCCEKKLWGEALFISSHYDSKIFKKVIEEYIKSSFLPGTPMYSLFSLMSGFGTEIFQPQKTISNENEIIRKFGVSKLSERVYENLAILLLNEVSEKRSFILSLCKMMGEGKDRGNRVCSDICNLLACFFATEGELIDKFGQRKEEFLLLGSENTKLLRPIHFRQTEIIHFIKKNICLQQKKKYIRDYRFDRYVLIYSLWCAELGLMDKAKEYIFVVENKIKELTRIYDEAIPKPNGKVPFFLKSLNRDFVEIKNRISRFETNVFYDEGITSGGAFGFIKKGFSGIMGLVSSSENSNVNLQIEEEEDDEEYDAVEIFDIGDGEFKNKDNTSMEKVDIQETKIPLNPFRGYQNI